jgi:signal peptidase II
VVFIYLFFDKDFVSKHFIAIGFILGGGISNVLDRFNYIGVVDYIYYHCIFNFAIFNLADICINIGVFLILLILFLDYKKQKNVL